ncbi:UNVERIFIED_CONTAM: hypothetical protein RMT77_003254 [Armadillidium vulgare]
MNILKLQRLMIMPLKTSLSTSAAPAKKVDFFYDVVSPYSWFAFEVLHRYKNHWNIDLRLRPVLLGGIFKITNNKSPLFVTSKARNLLRDLPRCSKYYDVPLLMMQNPMELLEKGSMKPMRFLTAVSMICPEHLEEASRQFWMIRWNKDEDFNTEKALEEVGATCGMSNEEYNDVIAKLNSDEVKSKLKEATNYAVECEAFGVPTTVVHVNNHKHMFFGSDRFPLIAQELEEEWKGPVPYKSSKL